MEQITVFWRLFETLACWGLTFRKIQLGLYGDDLYLQGALTEALRARLPELSIVERGAHGGFTNWTAKLLSNSKERQLISGLASERIISGFLA